MNTASLGLCKELYELSGWEATRDWWFRYLMKEGKDKWIVRTPADTKEIGSFDVPAYDLGYLLRKLPNEVMKKQLELHRRTLFEDDWLIRYDVMELVPSNQGWYGALAVTPEDAAAKLAIKLFKQGVLTRGGDE